MIDAATLDAIRDANPLADLLARDYGQKILPHGAGRKRLLCIFHCETDASLVLNENTNTFKCFGCGEHGDVFKIVMKLDTLTFPRAVEKLARRGGIPLHGGNGKKPAETRTPAQPKTEASSERDLSAEWGECVAAFIDEHAAKLATWRGYSTDFVTWLRSRELVGLYEGKIAFPVQDDAGRVVALHYREKDGSWRYHPTGCKVRPLVIGDVEGADVALAFESQWDAFAVLDKMGWHKKAVPGWCVIVTRGASNGKLVRL
ncbi:MAG: CHC2 zinc finger domain-containing protein [Verrucomicrobiia bacterium]